MATKKAVDKKVNIPVFLVVAMIILGVLTAIIAITINNSSRNKLESKPIEFIFEGDVASGIDVSEYNKEIDWQTVSQTQQFAFIRVGYRGYGNGVVVEDARARENLENANKAGIPVGVYFYTQAVNEDEARKEAEFVCDIIKDYEITLPVVIDFEYATDELGKQTGRLYDAKNDKDTNTGIINEFTSVCEARGYSFGVYASSSVLYRNIDTSDLNDDTLIWVADYNGTVLYNVKYNVWQYSKLGSCDGVPSKYVDLNYWYKN